MRKAKYEVLAMFPEAEKPSVIAEYTNKKDALQSVIQNALHYADGNVNRLEFSCVGDCVMSHNHGEIVRFFYQEIN